MNDRDDDASSPDDGERGASDGSAASAKLSDADLVSQDEVTEGAPVSDDESGVADLSDPNP